MQRFTLAFAIPLSILAASCSKADIPPNEIAPMTSFQTYTNLPLCVGRFLIDVPADAQVTWTDTRTSMTGSIKSNTPAYEKTFAGHISEELKRVETAGASIDEPLLKESRALKEHRAQLLVFRDSPSNDLFYDVKAITLKVNTLITFHDQAENDKLALAIRDLSKAVELASSRETWTIPIEPGFCFDHGFLPGRDSTFEATGVQISSPQFPGLMIALETQTSDQSQSQSPTLIARVEQGQEVQEPSQRATFLRKNPLRNVGGRTGQEVVTKRLNDGALRLTGHIEVLAEPGRLDLPGITFSLSLAPPKSTDNASPSEESGLGLWDRVVNSIRLRPGAL
jgi:hypothetical protein